MGRVMIILVFTLVTGVTTAQEVKDEIRKSIYFPGGSSYISDEQVSELFEWLEGFPNLLEKYEIQLISHTDPIGGRQFNERLSKMRSSAVKQLLLDKEIPEGKIRVKDWGLENPVYNNDSYEGKLLNRRVDVILYPILF